MLRPDLLDLFDARAARWWVPWASPALRGSLAGPVTGFLGPNGSGKSTTMRMIVGLARPDAGSVLIDGTPLSDHPNPLGAVGALIDTRAAHPARSAHDHLRSLAATADVGRARVREVLQLVGLGDVAKRRVRRFSLGMSQRLGIAAALLFDPASLLLDEPVNGLDPDGIRWIRALVRQLAAEGRAVLVSSHLMSEMAVTADHVIVIGRGRLIADESLEALIARIEPGEVRLRTPQPDQLRGLVQARGGGWAPRADGTVEVRGLAAGEIGDLCAEHRVSLHELIPVRASLEEAFMDLTADSVDYRAPDTTVAAAERDGAPVAERDGAPVAERDGAR
jgi:ABC-2 type transport system ATP-binding protein